MKELYLSVARSVAAAQKGNGGQRRWSPPSSDQIRALRSRLGMSQAKFAHEFGLDLNSLQNWEQGRSIPEPASRQIFWMIDANPNAAQKLVQAAAQRVSETVDG